MSHVSIRSLRKRFGSKTEVAAIDGIDLAIESGELLVLLGPSGCGKTTILRSLAGLETPDEGRIAIGDTVVFDRATGLHVPTERRDIGMVFQSYALWPHMSVRDNIAFPLRARRMKEQRRSGGWVDEAAGMVDCGHLLDRHPNQLSGGQQQRVSIARGIVARPRLILMDEPLSNLDARLRDQVRGELHELHRRLGFTCVYVTHDQTEALALGDRLAVMRSGHIEQLGTPIEIFERPATRYVADFVGFLNELDVERRGSDVVTSTGGRLVGGERTAPEDETQWSLMIRPDDLELVPAGERREGCVHLDEVEIADIAFMGRQFEVRVRQGSKTMRAVVPSRGGMLPSWLAAGGRATAAFAPRACQVYARDGARRDSAGVEPTRLALTVRA